MNGYTIAWSDAILAISVQNASSISAAPYFVVAAFFVSNGGSPATWQKQWSYKPPMARLAPVGFDSRSLRYFDCRRRPAARRSTSRAHEDVLPSAALSSLERSASVKHTLSMFVCRSFGFLGGRPAM